MGFFLNYEIIHRKYLIIETIKLWNEMLNLILLRVFSSMNMRIIKCITEEPKIPLTHKAIF